MGMMDEMERFEKHEKLKEDKGIFIEFIESDGEKLSIRASVNASGVEIETTIDFLVRMLVGDDIEDRLDMLVTLGATMIKADEEEGE